MNEIIYAEDVINVIRSFLMVNMGDTATEDIILSIGAELLNISDDKMLEIVCNCKRGL